MAKRMPKKKKTKKKEISPDDIDDILGQWFYALGEGAGSMRISRKAIRAIRDRYKEGITKTLEENPDLWDEQGAQVLHFVKVTGKLAAYLSFKDGHNFIDHTRVIKAAKMNEGRTLPSVRGGFCPPWKPTG